MEGACHLCSVLLPGVVLVLAVGHVIASDVSCDSADVVCDDGDVMVAALVEMNAKEGDDKCGVCDVAGLRSAFAVRWFFNRLNEENYIPGVKIGVETRRLCHSEARAARQAFDLLTSYVTNTNASQAPLFGVIGPTTSSSAIMVAQVFDPLPPEGTVPMISGSATADSLGNYSNFFRVIPPDGAQVEVILDLLAQLQWNYIAIVYTDDAYGRYGSSALRRMATAKGICVPIFIKVTDEFNRFRENSGTSRVAGTVFFGNKADAKKLLEKLKVYNFDFVKVIFSEGLGLQAASVLPDCGSSAMRPLTVTPQYTEVEEYRTAWNEHCNTISHNCNQVHSNNNCWLGRMQVKFGCSCTPLKDNDQELFAWYQIQASGVLAAALKSLHASSCPGQSGACPAFRDVVRQYQNTHALLRPQPWDLHAEFGNITQSFRELLPITFDAHGEVDEVHDTRKSRFEVFRFNCNSQPSFLEVGHYTNKAMVLDPSVTAGPASFGGAECQADKNCPECIAVPPADMALVVEGDFYFVAFAPVHNKDKQDALRCATARETLGADFVQAMLFALDEVHKEGGYWQRHMGNKTLGAIIMDSCSSPLVVKNKLFNLHKGIVQTPSGMRNVSREVLKRTAGYIGGFFSSVSLAMSDVLTRLDRKAYLHLSPTSVSSELSDTSKHPYFFRLTEPANSEVRGMLDLLQQLKATYVQIIYDSTDEYTVDFQKELSATAKEYGVCVAQLIDYPTVNAQQVKTKLRDHSKAWVVVVILQFTQINTLMETVADRMTGVSEHVFVGTEAWARRTELITGRRGLTGSLTMSEEIAISQAFSAHFVQVDPFNSSNFWLRDYWEERKQCYLPGSFRRAGRQACPPDYRQGYTQDPWIPYYIQAVYAFASGVGKAIVQMCPPDVADISTCLTTSSLKNKMHEVKLDLFGKGEVQAFDKDGNGKNGYKVMQVYWNSSIRSMQYRQIGNWTNDARLSLTTAESQLYKELPERVAQKQQNYESSCAPQCDQCTVAVNNEESTGTEGGDFGLPLIPVASVLGVLSLVILILLVVLLVCFRRRPAPTTTSESIPGSRIKFENDGFSDDSSVTFNSQVSSQPIQEGQASSRNLGSRGDLPYPQEHRSDSSDYASVNELDRFHAPPPPCGPRPKTDYLTAVHSPELCRKTHFV